MSDDLRSTIDSAIEEARERRHEYITLEHLLLALCADPQGLEVLQATGARVSKLIDELDEYLAAALEQIVVVEPDWEPRQTIAFWRVLQRAAMNVQGAGKEEVTSGSVLASLLREEDSQAVYLLDAQGVSRLDVVRYLSHGVTPDGLPGSELGGDFDAGQYSVRLGADAPPSPRPFPDQQFGGDVVGDGDGDGGEGE